MSDIDVEPFLADESELALPVQSLANLTVQASGADAESARVHIMHGDRPGQALISLDPADAATLVRMVADAFAAAWVGTNGACETSTVTP